MEALRFQLPVPEQQLRPEVLLCYLLEQLFRQPVRQCYLPVPRLFHQQELRLHLSLREVLLEPRSKPASGKPE